MEKIRIITQENLPRWYGLSWDSSIPAIVLSIHKDVLPEICPLHEDRVELYRKTFGFTIFQSMPDDTYGFDNAITCSREGELLICKAKLPIMRTLTDKQYSACDGTGNDDLSERECLYCEGTGTEYAMNWKTVYAISASLGLLFRQLYLPTTKTTSQRLQLFTIRSITGRGMSNCALGGMFSIALRNWSSGRGHSGPILEIITAMQTAEKHMMGKLPRFLEHYFMATVTSESGWLMISCPGNACGIHPSDTWLKDYGGYEFSSHNVDSPLQQLTLLAGLAALHDLVDKSLYPET